MSDLPKDNLDANAPEDNMIPYGDGYFIGDEGDGPDPQNEYNEPPDPPKKGKTVSLYTFVITTVALILAAVMTSHGMFTMLNKPYIPYEDKQDDTSDSTVSPEDNENDEYITNGFPFSLFSDLIEKYSFEETDHDERMAAALKAYVAATGDRYAYYYTPEEVEEMRRENSGENEGVGINIINIKAVIDGAEVPVMKVINVTPNSPALTAGVKTGDLIYGVGVGDAVKTVDELGYEMALTALQGKAGTLAEFTVKRPDGNGGYTTEEFSIEREAFISESIYHHVHSEDPTVGVIKILQFDLTTPQEFSADMDDLIAKGCTRFVFDVRYNPGGDLRSIAAVLSFFLQKDDVIIRTEYKDGHEEIDRVSAVTYGEDSSYHGCSVKDEDIGKYRREGFKFAVLCNGDTASAAELFTATFQDYELGMVVGTQTYGKGSMQRIRDLSDYGYGAIKLTVAKYYSGKNGGDNDGYDGVGITPDEVVELSADLADKNIYDITDNEDNQLQKALECLNK